MFFNLHIWSGLTIPKNNHPRNLYFENTLRGPCYGVHITHGSDIKINYKDLHERRLIYGASLINSKDLLLPNNNIYRNLTQNLTGKNQYNSINDIIYSHSFKPYVLALKDVDVLFRRFDIQCIDSFFCSLAEQSVLFKQFIVVANTKDVDIYRQILSFNRGAKFYQLHQ